MIDLSDSESRDGGGVLEAARALGITPRRLKYAIARGWLEPPDLSRANGFALARFSGRWLQRSRTVALTGIDLRQRPVGPVVGGGGVIFSGKFRRIDVPELPGVYPVPMPATGPTEQPALPAQPQKPDKTAPAPEPGEKSDETSFLATP